MADIFISYAREDEARIRELVHALEEHSWSIFWDRRIPAGKTWQSYIGQALSDAQLVIVAWSHHSITSGWVIEEANDAKERGVLVPVFLEPVKPPLGFRGIQAADLFDWNPGPSSPALDQLLKDIAGVLGTKSRQPIPDEEWTPQTQPVAVPRVIAIEPPPHESASPKLEALKVQPREPELTKPEPPEPSKKRLKLLNGLMIALAIAIVIGWVMWISREPTRQLKTKPGEPPMAVVPEIPTRAQEVSKPKVNPPAPEALQPEPALKSAVNPPETEASQTKPAANALPKSKSASGDEQKRDSDALIRTILERAAESADPAVATSLEKLATLYEVRGQYQDAEALWKQVLSIRHRAFGGMHPAVLRTLQSFASLYVRMGRFQDALALQKEACAYISMEFPQDHPATATCLNNLAVIYLKLEKYREAAPLVERALLIRSESLGSEDPTLIPLLENLADIYRKAGDQEKVELIEARISVLRAKKD